jgi:hypothetical protein
LQVANNNRYLRDYNRGGCLKKRDITEKGRVIVRPKAAVAVAKVHQLNLRNEYGERWSDDDRNGAILALLQDMFG